MGTLEKHPHEVGAWLLLIENTLRQAKEAWSGASNNHKALEELRKVIALDVACAEQHGMRQRHQDELKEYMRHD